MLRARAFYCTGIFERNRDAAERTIVNIGGARSSKSHSIAQLLLMKAANEPRKAIAVTRKTMPALRMTAQKLVLDLAREYGLYSPEAYSKTDGILRINSSVIRFFSIDDPEKVKSTEFNYIWMEEANEFEYGDYITLLTRLSAKSEDGERNRIYLSINPSDEDGWIPRRLLQMPDTAAIRSTYRDNPFVPKDYVETLEALKGQDESYYRIFALGEWGKRSNAVYPPPDYTEELPSSWDDAFWGLDFGYNNPAALVEARIKDGKAYAREALYSSGLTNADLCRRMEALIEPARRGEPVYADSAEPGRIEELCRAGFNAMPAEKSVRDGIDAVRRAELCITKDSVNLTGELRSYKWKTDKGGRLLDEPVKFNDHALDALRYAVHTHFRERGTRPSLTVFGN